MKKNSKLKKGKLALLAVAGTALVASLVYDKKIQKQTSEKLDKEVVNN